VSWPQFQGLVTVNGSTDLGMLMRLRCGLLPHFTPQAVSEVPPAYLQGMYVEINVPFDPEVRQRGRVVCGCVCACVCVSMRMCV
jgi:hypothetical protein